MTSSEIDALLNVKDGADSLNVVYPVTRLKNVLGAQTALAQARPRNLLDNGAFRIAQAGCPGNHGQGVYAADRWLCGRVGLSSASFAMETGNQPGLRMAANLSRDGWLSQLFETPNELMNRTLTFAVDTWNYGLLLVSGTNVANGPHIASGDGKLCIGMEGNGVTITLAAGGEAVLKWAALYEGAYTADTLPAFAPRGYASEMLECQRYFRTLNVLFGSALGAPVRQIINFTPPMRLAAPETSVEMAYAENQATKLTVNGAASNCVDVSGTGYGNARVTLCADV